MADVFISYKAERRPAVTYLTRVLENHGFTVWFDYGLAVGEAFTTRIEQEIDAARATVVLWCSMSVGSHWVLEEANLAMELGRLLPVRVEDTKLPFGFRGLDTIDLSKWDGNPRSGIELSAIIYLTKQR